MALTESPAPQDIDWPDHITRWQQSGLSAAQYCKRYDLIYHRFIYWKRKLSKPAAQAPAAPGGFIRVVPATSSLHQESGLTLVLPGGIQLKGLDEGNIPLLGQILAQL